MKRFKKALSWWKSSPSWDRTWFSAEAPNPPQHCSAQRSPPLVQRFWGAWAGRTRRTRRSPKCPWCFIILPLQTSITWGIPPNFRRQSMRKAHTRFSKSPKKCEHFFWNMQRYSNGDGSKSPVPLAKQNGWEIHTYIYIFISSLASNPG